VEQIVVAGPEDAVTVVAVEITGALHAFMTLKSRAPLRR
jgi:hypothetical protein